MITNELFNLTEENNCCTLEFHKKEINFKEDISFFDDSFFKSIRNKKILLKGKATVEIYAYAAYWCVKNSCESIIISDFVLSRNIEIYRKGKSISNSVPIWSSVTKESDSVIVSVCPSTSLDGQWDDEIILKNSSCFKIINPEKLTILTGRGSLLFYSIMACSSAVSGCDNVVIEKPTETNFITIAGSLFPEKYQHNKTGIMIGILGDPNSGKSVFSKVFGNILRTYSSDKSVWTYDCDAAAPTSDWYLYGLQRALSQEESDIKINARKSIKQKWSEELEMKVSEYMKTVKSNLDFVVADFPGGKHNEATNVHDRIPTRARAEMLRNCDFYIIIGRSDIPERINDWKKALAKYDLANRVIAEVISAKPQSNPCVENFYFDKEKVFHAKVCGLDRENKINSIVTAFCSAFQEFSETILSKEV